MKHHTPIVLASMALLGLYSANVSALPEGAIARLGDGAVGGTDRSIASSPDGGHLDGVDCISFSEVIPAESGH